MDYNLKIINKLNNFIDLCIKVFEFDDPKNI